LPDPAAAGHAIIFPPYPLTLSRVMESIKVGSTHRILPIDRILLPADARTRI
jgi:hypothetical protein